MYQTVNERILLKRW